MDATHNSQNFQNGQKCVKHLLWHKMYVVPCITRLTESADHPDQDLVAILAVVTNSLSCARGIEVGNQCTIRQKLG